MTHLTAALLSGFIIVVPLSLAVILACRTKAGEKALQAEELKLKNAAAREFEGAKPALIHASDSEIDKLPDAIDVVTLEAKAQAVLSALFTRLLGGNGVLFGSSQLMLGLLPLAFSAVPKTLDITAYKARLKDEMHQLITEAKL